MNLVEFPLSELEDWLPNIWQMLSEACERSSGKYLPMDVVRAVYARQMQLWNALEDNKIHAIALTEIVNYPHARVCRILAATGDNMEVWITLLPKLEEWAKERGCVMIEPVSRPGWKKVLKEHGYIHQHDILQKNL